MDTVAPALGKWTQKIRDSRSLSAMERVPSQPGLHEWEPIFVKEREENKTETFASQSHWAAFS